MLLSKELSFVPDEHTGCFGDEYGPIRPVPPSSTSFSDDESGNARRRRWISTMYMLKICLRSCLPACESSRRAARRERASERNAMAYSSNTAQAYSSRAPVEEAGGISLPAFPDTELSRSRDRIRSLRLSSWNNSPHIRLPCCLHALFQTSTSSFNQADCALCERRWGC